MKVRTIALFGWVVALAVVTSTKAAVWHRIESPHFELYTDGQVENARGAVQQFEALRAAVGDFLGVPLRNTGRLRLVEFRYYETFRQYLPTTLSKVDRVGGYAWLTPFDPTYICVLPSSRDIALRGVNYHEIVHLITADNATIPAWYGEGLGELFTTFRIQDRHCYVGDLRPDHISSLSRFGLIPVGTLLTIENLSAEFVKETNDRRYYPQAWLFVHYCTFGPDRNARAGLNTFLGLLQQGQPPSEEVFKRAFGLTFAEMDTRLGSYFRNGPFRRTKMAMPAIGEMRLRETVLEAAEAEALLKGLEVIAKQPATGLLTLQQMVAGSPESSRRHIDLAHYALLREDYWIAGRELEAAADLHREDARLAASAAHLQLVHLARAPSDSLSVDDAPRLRALCHRALAVDPGSRLAASTLAHVEARGPEVDPKSLRLIEALDRTEAFSATDALAFAIVKARTGDKAGACAVLDRLLASTATRAADRAQAAALRKEWASDAAP